MLKQVLFLPFFLPALVFAQQPSKQVAVTFDDLPFACMCESDSAKLKLTDKLIAGFKKFNVPVTGFVNEQKLYVNGKSDPARTALLKKWLDAGLELGNHGYNHVNINDISLADYQQEIVKGEVITRQLSKEAGKPYRYFRHPYLSPGNTLADRKALNAFLKSRKLSIAPNTITYQDYLFSDAYETALRMKNTLDAFNIRKEYIDYSISQFEAAEKQSNDLFGRQVKQILMIHANMLNAEAFPDVLAELQNRGYSFISLDAALKDPVYNRPDTVQGRVPINWMARWAAELGKNDIRYEKKATPPLVISTARQTTFNHEKAIAGSVKVLPPFVVVDKAKGLEVTSDSSLVLTAGPKTDLHNPSNLKDFYHNAPKLLFTPSADFELTAKIKPDFKNTYDGGAVLVYSDRENWAKILLEDVGDKLVLGNSVVKDKISDNSYFSIPQQKEYFLRVRKVGRVFTFFASPDGNKWDVVREFIYHKTGNMMIGFYSQSPFGEECAVEYSRIRYREL